MTVSRGVSAICISVFSGNDTISPEDLRNLPGMGLGKAPVLGTAGKPSVTPISKATSSTLDSVLYLYFDIKGSSFHQGVISMCLPAHWLCKESPRYRHARYPSVFLAAMRSTIMGKRHHHSPFQGQSSREEVKVTGAV